MDKLPIVNLMVEQEMQSDVSEASSWADARADTPTMARDNQSDSEDTLSSLSFDENGILSPTSGGSPDPDKSPGDKSPKMMATASPVITPFQQQEPVPAPRSRLPAAPSGQVQPNSRHVQVRVTGADKEGSSSDSLNLDLNLPSPTNYKAPTVDFPASPSQLKITLGPSFFPKEESGGPVSEDDVSFAASCRAKLDLNLQNGGVRLTKTADEGSQIWKNSGVHQLHPTFQIELSESEPSSFLQSAEFGDQLLDDYIEDFILPLSHETVMQRQNSFRIQVKKQLETAATERAISELGKFERMLSTYEEEGEYDSRTPTPNPPPIGMMDRRTAFALNNNKNGPMNFQYGDGPASSSFTDPEAYPSLLDIDAICNTHAPELMRLKLKSEDPNSILIGDSEESGYFIPKTTIDKLSSVYESNNFNDIYTLSGELRHILSPLEIEEIVANRVHLEKVIDPNVLAALSWPLNESSLPPYDLSLIPPANQNQRVKTQDPTRSDNSKTSSISNGFHSRNTSDASDDEVSTASTPNYAKSGRSSSGFDTPDSAAPPPTLQNSSFERGGIQTASFRRRIALAKSLAAEMEGGLQKTGDDDEYNSISLSPSPTGRNYRGPTGGIQAPNQNGGVNPDAWKSLESLNDLEIEDDIDSVADGTDELFLVRRDSKRFNKKEGTEERVIQGLFVESKMGRSNPGTLTRVRVPLHLSQEDVDGDSDLSPRSEEGGDTSFVKKIPKKRIPLDEDLLRTTSMTELDDSSQATDADVTLSEVFHSCLSKTHQSQDDLTIKSGSGTNEEDVTLDLDTPDDMEDSILGRLDSLAVSSAQVEPLPELSAMREDTQQWKRFSVGASEIQIDLRAIQPFRKVLSHGGYYDAEKKVAIILFSGCFLPDRSRRDYLYIMDQLFLYVLSSLEELIVDDYILVYLHGATPKSAQPSFGWLKRCYQLLDRKLRKNLKGVYLVHPSFWLRTVVALTKPFVSSKFSKKLQFVTTLAELCLELPTEHLVIPEPVLQYDFDMKVSALKKHMQ